MTQPPPTNVKWTKLVTTNGIVPAEMLVEQLQAAGITSFAWQQGAGEAFGFYVGPMGTAHVMVDEEQLDEARDFLEAVPVEWPEDLAPEEEPAEEESLFTTLSKMALTVTAVAISPVAVVAAAVITALFRRESPDQAVCPECGVEAALDAEEIRLGWYTCPGCGARVTLPEE